MFCKVSHICCVLASVFIYGQVRIELKTDKKEYNIKDYVTVTITLEIKGDDYEQQSPIQLPDFSKFYEKGAGSDKSTIINPSTNIITTQLVYQAVFQPKQSGNLKIGSALVRVNGRIYKTEPFDIFVSEDFKNTIAKNTDISFVWELEQKEVFINQPTLLILRAYAKDFNNLRKIGKIILPKQKNLQFEQVNGIRSDIEITENNYLSQVVANYVVYPKEAGKLNINPSVIEINESNKVDKVRTNQLIINVKDLPDRLPTNFKNAIGEFDIKLKKGDSFTNYQIGKPINIVLELSGRGNLSKSILPKIKDSQGYSVFSSKIIENIRNVGNDFLGTIQADYVIIPKKTGVINICTDKFSFFNPKTECYQEIEPKNLEFNVLTEEQVEKSALEEVGDMVDDIIKPSKSEVNRKKVLGKKAQHFDYYLFGVSILGILGLVIYFFRKKEKIEEKYPCEAEKNIDDIEAYIRKNQDFDIASYLKYLEMILLRRDFDTYVLELDLFLKSVEKHCLNRYGICFVEYIDNQLDIEFKDRYKDLQQNIQTEKYKPFHTEEEMNILHQKLEDVFNKIR